jgi:hypothetical protein
MCVTVNNMKALMSSCKVADNFFFRYYRQSGARGGAVVVALRYKPEGRGIDSLWFHWNFLLR